MYSFYTRYVEIVYVYTYLQWSEVLIQSFYSRRIRALSVLSRKDRKHTNLKTVYFLYCTNAYAIKSNL